MQRFRQKFRSDASKTLHKTLGVGIRTENWESVIGQNESFDILMKFSLNKFLPLQIGFIEI